MYEFDFISRHQKVIYLHFKFVIVKRLLGFTKLFVFSEAYGKLTNNQQLVIITKKMFATHLKQFNRSLNLSILLVFLIR